MISDKLLPHIRGSDCLQVINVEEGKREHALEHLLGWCLLLLLLLRSRLSGYATVTTAVVLVATAVSSTAASPATLVSILAALVSTVLILAVVVVVGSWLIGSLLLLESWHDESLDELVGSILLLPLLLTLMVILGLPDVYSEWALTGEWVVSIVELDGSLGCTDCLIEDVSELSLFADFLAQLDGHNGGRLLFSHSVA